MKPASIFIGSVEPIDIKVHRGEYVSMGIWHDYASGPEIPPGSYSGVEVKVLEDGSCEVRYDPKYTRCIPWSDAGEP